MVSCILFIININKLMKYLNLQMEHNYTTLGMTYSKSESREIVPHVGSFGTSTRKYNLLLDLSSAFLFFGSFHESHLMLNDLALDSREFECKCSVF